MRAVSRAFSTWSTETSALFEPPAADDAEVGEKAADGEQAGEEAAAGDDKQESGEKVVTLDAFRKK